MRALILGIGDAFTARHFGSSALLRAPGGHVLLDCPDLIHRALREATEAAGWRIAADDVHDIILTHLHGDHCNGLESFGFLRRIRRRQDERLPIPRLHTVAPVAERLWERLAPAMDASMDDRPRSTLEDYFDVRLLDPDGVNRVAGLDVWCRATRHPIPTIGLRLADGDGALGWSGDTPFEPAHVEWLAAADLIVHECNRGPAHTTIDDLEALPEDVRSRLRLIHLPDDFDATRTDIPALREGQVLQPQRVASPS
ncbi:MAG: MBL fold metallo-hydrolase [Planctomycetota bacterium]|jgi:ribonuclease BN (tRNA processing enzyme)